MRNTDIRIRDPYIVADKETNQYFLFGTTDSDPWNGEGEGFKVYRSENLEEWVEAVSYTHLTLPTKLEV